MKYMRLLTPENCLFSLNENDILRVELKDEICCMLVRCKRLFPIRHPDSFISILDGKDEIGIIEDLSEFDNDMQKMIKAELNFLFGVPSISEIREIKNEYGFFHWVVFTDRGEREFYVKGRTESVKRVDSRKLYITDINNCRFQIDDLDKLSSNSRSMLAKML